jgi:hypothetical protein
MIVEGMTQAVSFSSEIRPFHYFMEDIPQDYF